MPRSLKSTVFQRADGQTLTTIPKRFGTRYELGDRPVAFRVETADRIALIHQHLDEGTPTCMVNRTGGQYKVSIPTGLAHAMRLIGATLDWDDPTKSRLTAEVRSRGENA